MVGIAATFSRLLAGTERVYHVDRFFADPYWNDEILQRVEINLQVRFVTHGSTKVSFKILSPTCILSGN